MITLAESIRQRRVANKLSLSELARLARVSKGYLHRLENDPNTRPSARVVERLAIVLGSSIPELLGKDLGAEPKEIVPPALLTLARKENLPPEIVRMLARIEYLGARPQTEMGFWFIWQSIVRTIARE
jgi:transcriptional regulator with XRE-family HTH domain